MRRRLRLLDDLVRNGWKKDILKENKNWLEELQAYPELKALVEDWLKDRCLENFSLFKYLYQRTIDYLQVWV
jgi:hypothetical protein